MNKHVPESNLHEPIRRKWHLRVHCGKWACRVVGRCYLRFDNSRAKYFLKRNDFCKTEQPDTWLLGHEFWPSERYPPIIPCSNHRPPTFKGAIHGFVAFQGHPSGTSNTGSQQNSNSEISFTWCATNSESYESRAGCTPLTNPSTTAAAPTLQGLELFCHPNYVRCTSEPRCYSSGALRPFLGRLHHCFEVPLSRCYRVTERDECVDDSSVTWMCQCVLPKGDEDIL